MKFIYNDAFLNHETGQHPENPSRLKAFGHLPSTKIIDAEKYLELVHKKEYIAQIKELCRHAPAQLDGDTILSQHSYDAAVKAVGAAIMVSQTNDFALVRPPGHHAFPSYGSGFCIFNNIAVAAANLLKEKKRVLIFDFDGHAGDGTGKTFYKTDQLLYWSIHQSPAFPYWGSEDQIGDDKGRGFTINMTLPPESGDDLFLKAIEKILPIAKQFSPDVVGISAGFDAHQFDPILNLRLSASAYYRTGQILKNNFKNIFAVLEGGYNTQELPRCAKNFLAGINGEEIFYAEAPTDSDARVRKEFDARLESLEFNLKSFWKIS